LLITQLHLEISDECLNRRLITQYEKQITKRFSESMEKIHGKNLLSLCNQDSEAFLKLTEVIDSIIEAISELSINELVTFNKQLDEYITTVKEDTAAIKS